MTVQSRTISPCGPSETCTCGSCGGLECLCRPRFFAGQLLTEEDLNRLDHYIRARFRTHNLSVHGDGVVGGLKVLCDPCGEVKVTVGHAISPCGDDIIVCDDTGVPVCDLIRKCKMSERKQNDCDLPRRIPGTDCEDLEEEWVLAIKYDEAPTRGVIPLRTSGTCSLCGCGGQTCACSDCDCDACCTPSKRNTAPKPRSASPTCEPSVICEGFRFCVYRKPEEDPERGDNGRVRFWDRDSELIQQLQCCIELLVAAIPVMPDVSQSTELSVQQRQALVTFCCRLKQNLLDYFTRHPHTNCEVIDILGALRCPDANNADGFANAIVASVLQLFAIWLDAIKQCFCLALLPPAPAPTCEDRVALATVRVRGRDCKVLSVCNWTTERDILVTWTSVSYWLGSLGIWDVLRDGLDTICCSSLVGLFDEFLQDDTPGFASANPDTVAFGDQANSSVLASLSARLDSGFARAGPALGLGADGVNIRAFTQSVAENINQPAGLSQILNASSSRFRLPESGRALDQAERDNLPELLTLELVGKPILAGLLGTGQLGRNQTDTPEVEIGGKLTGSAAVEMTALRTEIERQRVDIDLLKRAIVEREAKS